MPSPGEPGSGLRVPSRVFCSDTMMRRRAGAFSQAKLAQPPSTASFYPISFKRGRVVFELNPYH
jgi:hypothetical protein